MITITENAAKYINNYLTKRGKGLGVRLGVKTSGCSGMAYNLEFVDEANEDDLIFEEHGARCDSLNRQFIKFQPCDRTPQVRYLLC